jgi:hypothetical protein
LIAAANPKTLLALIAENAELKADWSDPAKQHVNRLSSGYPRNSALHLGSATDYDALKADAERYRKAVSCEDNAEMLYGLVISYSP